MNYYKSRGFKGSRNNIFHSFLEEKYPSIKYSNYCDAAINLKLTFSKFLPKNDFMTY